MLNLLKFLMLFFLIAPLGLRAQKIDQSKLLNDIEYLSSDELGGRKPLSEGSLKARKYIQERFRELGLKSQYPDFIQYFDFQNNREGKLYENAANIVGFVGGKETEKLIVIMAHYDHIGKNGEQIFNGADDNASGTGAVLALAEYFSKNRPNHSMLFVALDAEEMGHQGAKALVDDFPFPIEQTVLNINMDMISRNVDGEIYAVGTYHYPQLKPIIENVAEGRFPKLLFGHDVPGQKADWTNASDHSQFHKNRIPFIYFGVEDHEDYHKVTDTFERIQPEFYSGAVELILDIIIAFDRNLNKE
ncbi:M28 family peptidase [Aquiflexum gelatinilyticum]|uniref:M28 family peptidase n=1 Tax=Aquiflexum gelatinilyticum TaxID=2961943 RepID=UPI002167B559|nr:M28 family peptidase [Aquiflexum gelatinilyticum]MCS4435905.1 M28 family peptidase [Aquiflexum gelatinilyticum]